MNNWDFNFSGRSSDGKDVNLKTELLKNLGYLAGLTHCGNGECSNSDGTIITSNLPVGQSDPPPDSVLYKFPQTGIKDTISSDDVSNFAQRKTKKNLHVQTNEFYELVKRQIPNFSKENLGFQLYSLNKGIMNAIKLKEDAANGYNDLGIDYWERIIQTQLELRQMTIDRLGDRP